MTLDEAIRHAEEVAESKEKQVKNGDWEKDSLTERNCIKCAEEHRQLAEWLRDYKRLKEQTEITWVAGADGAKVAFLDVPILKVLKICEILQEPCDVPDINVGDMISRQTVLDTISELNAISFYEAQEDSKECYYEIRQAIKALPPVKPQDCHIYYHTGYQQALTDVRQEIYRHWHEEPCVVEHRCLDEIITIIDKCGGRTEWMNILRNRI